MHPCRAALLLVSALCASTVAAGAGCLQVQATVPVNKPVFPTGLALDAAGQHLIVVSSDFDSAFNDGALLSADLDLVRAVAPSDNVPVVASAYSSGVIIPPVGDHPVITPLGDRVLLPARKTNTIISVDLAADGTLSCGSNATPQKCGASPAALQVPENDPFTVLVLSQPNPDRVNAMAMLLSSPVITFFSDDKSRAGSARMRADATLDLGDTIAGVRSAVLRPATGGTSDVVIAAADLSTDAGFIGVKLLVFQPNANTNVASFDVSAATGSLSMRDMVLVPGEGGANDALVAILRSPDAIARFTIEDAGSLPLLRMTALSPTCREPMNVALWSDGASHPDRVLLTCHSGDTVEALDPVTLEATDAVRFEGRGPYDVVVDQVNNEAYVSFFEDNSVGQLSLLDADAHPKLTLERRIGEQLPKPEDGRQ